MNLQQLEYIVALDTPRHFARAAEACGVSQPTLSSLVQKLEEELDAVLFNRSHKPLEPTDVGRRVIDQARVVLSNIENLRMLTLSEREQNSGAIHVREVSLVIRRDYLRERIINSLVDAVKAIIPDNMIDARLKKFAVRL